VGSQRHGSAALTSGTTQYLLYRKLGGIQGRSGRVQKISPTTGIRSTDRRACSKSLYRLSYSNPQIAVTCWWLLRIRLYEHLLLTQLSSVMKTANGARKRRLNETCPCCMDVTDTDGMVHWNCKAHVCLQTQMEQLITLCIKRIFQSPKKTCHWVQQRALPIYFFTTSNSRVTEPTTPLLSRNKPHHFYVPPCGNLKLHIRGLLKSKFCHASRLTPIKIPNPI